MHPSRQTDRAHSAGTVLALQQRRLQQILWAVMAAFGTAALMSFSKGGYTSVALELVALALLGLAYWWNQRGELARASRWMLGTLIAGIFSLMATGEGLYDEGVLAFPAILIFAGMFGNRRMLWVLMAWLQGALVLLFVLHQTGVIRAAAVPVDLQRLVMMVAILAAIGFFVWLLTGDLHSTLAQLASEKEALAESHERIDVLAHRDTLTQLPNRTLAKDRLEQLLLQARRDQRMVAALYLDLDNFTTVNDSLGHAVGDELLCLVAERLGSGLRECDTVARLSGDEFLILLGDIQSEEAVTTSAARVLQLLAQPFALQGLDVVVTTSLGIAVAPRDGSDVDELLKNADMAMYRAKDSGRNAFRFFDASMNESVVEHLHMASGLRTALAQGELQVHYQPQFDLHSGRIIGAEALLRWKHPTLGFVPPGKFIPVAERTGLINEVGAWVLQRACLDAKAWRLQGLGELTVAVNVSPLQFHRDNIEREVANALTACQLPASALELELTESLLVADAHHLSEVLQRLRTLGVQIAIDDFGTGYSSLSALQQFPIATLKIDQSFVRDATTSHDQATIVAMVIEM
ncbi:MAG: putative bifunctional diguanylate cyclase/phosphodiesterase, partial [Giesbergeria sp.]